MGPLDMQTVLKHYNAGLKQQLKPYQTCLDPDRHLQHYTKCTRGNLLSQIPSVGCHFNLLFLSVMYHEYYNTALQTRNYFVNLTYVKRRFFKK